MKFPAKTKKEDAVLPMVGPINQDADPGDQYKNIVDGPLYEGLSPLLLPVHV